MFCSCGCGKEIPHRSYHSYHPVQYISGHNNNWKEHSKPRAVCAWCQIEFVHSGGITRKYCSRRCYEEWQSSRFEEKKCFTCGKTFKKRISEILKRDGVKDFCTRDCYRKARQSGYSLKGSKHPQWKGGITELNQRLRTRFKFKSWRRQVLNRDGGRCTVCGSVEKLEAHHIKSWSKYPHLRYDINNGITLCRFHHSQTDSFCRG